MTAKIFALSLVAAATLRAAAPASVVALDPFGRLAHDCRVEATMESGESKTLPDRRLPAATRHIEIHCREGSAEQTVDPAATDAILVIAVRPLAMHSDPVAPQLRIRVAAQKRNPLLAQWIGVSVVSRATYLLAGRGEIKIPEPHSGIYTLLLSTDARNCIVNVEIADFTREWSIDFERCSVQTDRYAIVIRNDARSEEQRRSWETEMVREQKSLKRDIERNLSAVHH